MFNKIKFAAAGVAIAASFASTAAFAAPATETADAVVNVLGPVSITVDNALDFGTIAPGSSGGTVIVPATTDAANCSGVVCLAGSSARGEFHISQAIDGATVEISVGSPTDLEHDTDTTAPAMALTDLTMSDADGQITYDVAAAEAVYVGGTLTVAVNQPAGTYTGSFEITADYP
jgi:hypothetical protein